MFSFFLILSCWQLVPAFCPRSFEVLFCQSIRYSCIRQGLVSPIRAGRTSRASLPRLIKISFELLKLADSSKGGRQRETRQGRGIKGREAEKCPGQNSGATGDVDGVKDKGNNTGAGGCLLVWFRGGTGQKRDTFPQAMSVLRIYL